MGYWSRKSEVEPKQAIKRRAQEDLQHDTTTAKKSKVDDNTTNPTTTDSSTLKANNVSELDVSPDLPVINVQDIPSTPAAVMPQTNTIPTNPAATDSSLFKDSTDFRRLYATGKIVLSTPIKITAGGSPDDFEPGDLTPATSRLYKEGIAYFYRDNKFILQVKDYDIRAFLPWLDRATQYRQGAPCDGSIMIALHGDPHWENLVDWLKLAHSGKVTALENNCESDDDGVRAVKGAFAQVMALWEYKWDEETELILRGMRTMLAALDPLWNEDHPAGDPKVEDTSIDKKVKDDVDDDDSSDDSETTSVSHEDQNQDEDESDQSPPRRDARSPSSELGSTFAATQGTYQTALEQQFQEESQDKDGHGESPKSQATDTVKNESDMLTPASTPAPAPSTIASEEPGPATPTQSFPSCNTNSPSRTQHPRKARLQRAYLTDQPKEVIKAVGALPKHNSKGMR